MLRIITERLGGISLNPFVILPSSEARYRVASEPTTGCVSAGETILSEFLLKKPSLSQ
jgi:hypothetical protein